MTAGSGAMVQILGSHAETTPSTDRPDGIGRLPVELLEHTFRFLPRQSLKQARLTCPVWANAGGRCLFRRVYFAPRPDAIELLVKIVENPTFATNIDELVYDARLFWRYLVDTPEHYALLFRLGFPDSYPLEEVEENDLYVENNPEKLYNTSGIALKIDTDLLKMLINNVAMPNRVQARRVPKPELANSIDRYQNLYLAQQVIIDGQKDREVLRWGLSCLPNLKRVVVLDHFDHPLDFDAFHYEPSEFEWYSQWSAKAFEGIAAPARWSEADRLDDGVQLEHMPWDFRGIKHLLMVIEAHAPRVHDLSLGCQTFQLSPENYCQAGQRNALCSIAPRLRRFKLDCEWPNSSGFEAADFVTAMTKILQAAIHLESLSLTVNVTLGQWSDIFQGHRWPYLKVLDLGDGNVESEAFRAILKNHEETLQELILRNMHIRDGLSWEDFAKNVGQFLELHFLSLSSMSDEIGALTIAGPYLDDLRALTTANSFFQRTPSHLRATVATGRAVVRMWNKRDFKPSFDLDAISKKRYNASLSSSSSTI